MGVTLAITNTAVVRPGMRGLCPFYRPPRSRPAVWNHSELTPVHAVNVYVRIVTIPGAEARVRHLLIHL